MVGKLVNVGGVNAEWLDTPGYDSSWYRGDTCNLSNGHNTMWGDMAPEAVNQFILHGWKPEQPFITRDTLLTTLGSCFAQHVEEHLRDRGYKTSISLYGSSEDNFYSHSLIIKCNEGFVNTFSIRTNFDWVLGGEEPEIHIWHKSEGVIREYVDGNRAAAIQMFKNTGCFVITLGLAEVWYDKRTNKVLWTGVPKSLFNPDHFGFRVSTVDENKANLAAVVDQVRKHLGPVPIIFTLSPVPLRATFRPVSCATASSVSKAILRVAVDELMRERTSDPNLYYFPSYELVTKYIPNPWEYDGHHPTRSTITAVMEIFQRAFCL